MPTPSEAQQQAPAAVSIEDWSAHPSAPPRSVFNNYLPRTQPGFSDRAPESGSDQPPHTAAGSAASLPLEAMLDRAMARAFTYRFLAQAFQDPTEEGWAQLTEIIRQGEIELTVGALVGSSREVAHAAAELGAQIRPERFESFLNAYLAAFGHAARGRCPLNEIEYGDLKADPLFQPHRLADLAAFFHAFGLEIAEEADERQDHLCLELEFMCVLAAKEAYALEHHPESNTLSVCRDAQKRFLREHLGRWTPAFARRLAVMAADSPLAALANFTRAFVEAECARLGVPSGSEDLLLRPADEQGDSSCQACTLNQLLPGASPTPVAAV